MEKTSADYSLRDFDVRIDINALSRRKIVKIVDVPQTLRSSYYAVDLAYGKDCIGQPEALIRAKEKEMRNFIKTLKLLCNEDAYAKNMVKVKLISRIS